MILHLFFQLLLATSLQTSRSDDFQTSVLHLSGAASLEELSEAELERYQSLSDHPLDINNATRSQLMSTGFFTPFQVASLLDCIHNGGDILSIAELGTVPGIGPQMARDLEPFVSLEVHGPAGAPKRGSLYSDARLRSGVRSGKWTTAFKSSASLDSRYSAALAVKDGVLTSASLGYSGRVVSRAVAGSFSARFGQGLLMWSGFSLSGVPSVQAFSRNAGGFAPSSTFNASSCLKGVAASLDMGRTCISLAADVGGLQLVNINHLLPCANVGITAVHDNDGLRTSADFTLTAGKFTFAGEGALDFVGGGSAALFSAIWNISYGKKAALLARTYSPSYSAVWAGAVRSSSKVADEYALSAGLQLPCLSFTADAALHPGKGAGQYKGIVLLQKSYGCLTPAFRGTVRFRPEAEAERLRSELRFDLDLSVENFSGRMRLNAVNAVGWGLLGYLEAGWVGKACVYARVTLFRADSWADRIYVYERDVPGSFNVPAYSGRGWSLSLYGGWKELKIRLATTQYPWSGKAPLWELKLMVGIRSQNLKPRLMPNAGV